MNTIAPARLEEIAALLEPTAFKGGELLPLAGDASFRRYIRVKKAGDGAMLMDAPPGKEDVRPFIAWAEYLRGKGFSAPRILARNLPAGLLLLEDLGDDSYSALLRRDPAKERELYAAAIDVLAAWGNGSPAKVEVPRYDHPVLMREVMLLSDWFLPQVAGKERATALRAEYEALWRDILAQAQLKTEVWVHRDYHADNLMWLPGRAGHQRVGLLDFQDGLYGDPAYDLVSLLEDARRDVAPALAGEMLERYLAASGADREAFLSAYAVLGAQRNSKIIGIFTRLAARDGKAHYLDFLPRVWGHLQNDLKNPLLLPLKNWLDLHVPMAQRGVIALKHISEDL